MTNAPILEAQDLHKTFILHLVGGRAIGALKGVSLSLQPGEFVAIMGRTGAGKSTLMKSLLGIYRPTAGKVLYRRADAAVLSLSDLPETALLDLLAGEIGYVSQTLRVVPRVGALDLLAEAAPPDLPREETLKRGRALMADLALPAALEFVYPITFSGGEKQRLNLALTLMRAPRLLLLDEPTAALDPETRDVIVEILAAQKRAGVTILGIFHDPSVVDRLADRVIWLERGCVLPERSGTAIHSNPHLTCKEST